MVSYQRVPSRRGLALVLVLLVVLMGAAYLIERWYLVWLRKRIKQSWPTIPQTTPKRMPLVLARFFGRAVGIFIFCSVAVVLAALALGADGVTELTMVAVVGGVGVTRLIIEFWRVWTSPVREEYRLVALGTADARALHNWLAGSAILSIGFGTFLSVASSVRAAQGHAHASHIVYGHYGACFSPRPRHAQQGKGGCNRRRSTIRTP